MQKYYGFCRRRNLNYSVLTVFVFSLDFIFLVEGCLTSEWLVKRGGTCPPSHMLCGLCMSWMLHHPTYPCPMVWQMQPCCTVPVPPCGILGPLPQAARPQAILSLPPLPAPRDRICKQEERGGDWRH